MIDMKNLRWSGIPKAGKVSPKPTSKIFRRHVYRTLQKRWSVAGPAIGMLLAVTLMLSASRAANVTLRLATSSSTHNSGLLDYLLPRFEARTGIKTRLAVVGSGRALLLARRGEVDAVLSHAPDGERKLVRDGFAMDYRYVMHNDFVLLGPPSDPAEIEGLRDIAEALQRIARTRAMFVSRGDDSGTHRKELMLWREAGNNPHGIWYFQAGAKMAASLKIASDKAAYILADHGTWLVRKKGLALRLLVEGDRRLFNPYGVLAVNPARYPKVNYSAAKTFIDWITSKEGQSAIGSYQINGTVLFKPPTDKNKADR